MKNKIPQGPHYNPHVEDGTYDAVIDHVRTGTYHGDDAFYLQFVCRLPELNLYFVTNIYFPQGKARKSEQRLYCLCSTVGLDVQDAKEHPQAFKGKRLRVKIARMQKPKQNGGLPYYDVKLFFPP